MTPFQVNYTNKLIFCVFTVFNLQCVTPKNLSSLNYVSVDRCCLRDGSGNCSDTLSSFNNKSYFDLPNHLLMPSLSNTSIRLDLKTSVEDEKCKSAKEVVINLKILTRGNETDDNMREMKFTPDGFFKYGDDYFTPEEYCVKSNSLLEEHLVLDLCLPDCDKNSPCLTRCCELGQVFDFSQKMQCVSSGGKQWEPTVYKNPSLKLTRNETRKFHFVSKHPKTWCNPDYGAIIYSFLNYSYFERSLFRILDDGSVKRKTSRRIWETLSAGTYCIEGTQNIPGLQQEYSGDENQTILFVCEKPKEMKKTSISIIYGIAQIISCVFLLMTVIVYALLWEKQNIHGWTLLGYVTSMFCLYMLNVTTYIYVYLFNEFSIATTSGPLMCKYLAVATHFFFLSTFFWMTLINFDLYSTFKNLKPTAGNSKRKRRFFIYALFAFGLPLSIVAAGITLDNRYGEDIESEVIVPQYGKFKCYLDLELAALPYLYGPIGLLLFANTIFFVITVYSMYRIQQTTKIATNNSSQRQSQRSKQKTLLFLKIFSVMGIQWISEVITWACFGSDSPHLAVIILDIINILQPIAIFVIFVCKADICNSLRQKYRLIDRTATSLSIDALTADRIVHRWPKLERVIGPITRKEEDRRRRGMSTTTELTNLSVRQTSVSQIQLHDI